MEESGIKNESSVKNKLGWGPTAAIFVSISAYVFSQLVIVIPILLIKSLHTEKSESFISYVDNSSWASLLLAGFSAIGLLAFLYVFLKMRKKGFASLGFSRIRISHIGWLVLALVSYVILLMIAMSIAAMVPGFDSNQKQDVGFVSASGWQLLLAFTGLVIIPPVAEEIVFRGFLYRGLASKWPKILSALTTSLIFALLHFQWNVSLDVFILSLVLIALFEKTKNLWMCVFLHGLKNFIAFATIFLFATR